ncbi:GtrA family protein [Vagococcus carniphilus]|uniref:GtrA family protein n=1 Tax=Vagococcus carniphilus TaxID=218144 RepID=UPI00288FF1EA|nr:GtrA family protein [Vagococcus carniphilus]MDT2816085.1 GtrA family protein [Vagococcus carniphilus]MDT2866436.1 GtrA family protein [Vagococcus carniphilus]
MINRKEFLLYTIAGTTGTFIYFFARFTSKGLTDNVLIPVIVGQICAIVFSFFANKFFVFKNTGTGFKKACHQFFEFCIGRALVFLLDLGIAFFFVDKYGKFWINHLGLRYINYQNAFFANPMFARFIGSEKLLNEFIFTVISQVLATIINYFFSKKIVFKIQKSQEAIAS